MPSTYSALKIELIATGEQSGEWGNTTNTNLGTALGQAITGSADVTFSSADVTLTFTDTNAAQSARALRLNLTGTSGGARELIVPSISGGKAYLINNGLSDAVTVKNSSGTGIAVPSGKSMWVYNTGSNVVDGVTYLSSLTLGSALPVGSGGTGATSSGAAPFALKGANSDITSLSGLTTPLSAGQGGTNSAFTEFTGAGTSVKTYTLPNASTTILTTNDTVTVAQGGTGQSSYTDGQLLIGNTTGNTLAKSTLTAGAGITITNGSGSITIAPDSGYNGYGARTVSTSSPSAGSDGDIWYQY